MIQSTFSLLLLLAAPQEPATSQIDRVTVYTDAALVERTTSLRVDRPGPYEFTIAPLPPGADPDSFQIRVENGSVLVQSLESQSRSRRFDPAQRRELEVQLEALQRQMRELETERSSIRTGISLIEASIAAIQAGKSGTDPATLEQLLESLPQNRERFAQQQLALDERAAVLQNKIDDVKRQIGAAGRTGGLHFEAKVRVFFERAGDADFRFSYLVPNADWNPQYEVRLKEDLESIRVSLQGNVSQSSGEDWNDVQLVLSTSRPKVGLTPPMLTTRWLQIGRNRHYAGSLKSLGYADGSTGMAELGYMDADSPVLHAAAPVVKLRDLGLSQQFVLPDRVTLASSGGAKTWSITNVPLDVDPERYVVPSMSTEAYLRAEVTSAADMPLLAGEARVFLGPDFIGKAMFPVLRPGDSTMLPLGIDPNLTVEFEPVKTMRDEPGFLSSTVTQHRSWRVKLALSKAARGPIDVLVEEALPVSQDERIRVTYPNLTPRPLATEADVRDQKEKGIFRWRLALAPGKEAQVQWGYRASFDEKYEPVVVQN